MVAAAATSAFFTVASSPKDNGTKNNKLVNGSTLGMNLIKSKAASGGMQVKANAQAPNKINETTADFPKMDRSSADDTPSPVARTFINQLPDWSMLLAVIRAMLLAAEKQWMMLDWKPKRPDMLGDYLGPGKLVQDGFVFRQYFSIRSYEIGADGTASTEAMMNLLQEAGLNHCKSADILGDGFGSIPEMCKRNLIWVVARVQVLFDRNPSWGYVVQVDTWLSASGKNGVRRDLLVRDSRTGEVLTRASCLYVMMNKLTRKLSKFPQEVRAEIEPHFMNSSPALVEDSKRLPKLDNNTADYINTGITPRWSDLDVNLHVNNVKYIGWIHDCVPLPILESHELVAMTLEYRRECGKDDVLQSLIIVSDPGIGNSGKSSEVVCQHLLQLENGTEIMRGRTDWRPKKSK